MECLNFFTRLGAAHPTRAERTVITYNIFTNLIHDFVLSNKSRQNHALIASRNLKAETLTMTEKRQPKKTLLLG